MRTKRINSVLRAFMFFVLLAVTSGVMAQEYVVVDYKDKEDLKWPKEQVKKIEFIFKNRIECEADTTFLPASSVKNYFITEIRSYAPLTAAADCEWADITLLRDSSLSESYKCEYYAVNITLQANKSGNDRIANIIFESEGAESVTLPVVQRKHVSSFYESSFYNGGKWDGEAVKELNNVIQWNDSTAGYSLFPNFGFTLESYPEWIDSVKLYCYDETDKYENVGTDAYIGLWFKKNNTATLREGTVVLRDINGEELKINLKHNPMSSINIRKKMNSRTFESSRHFDYGYPSLLHIRDVMTADLTVPSTGYDWYDSWACNQYMGESFVYAQYIWNTYRDLIFQSNLLLANINDDNIKEPTIMGAKVEAHIFRALFYLEAAQMYEFLPNDKTSNINTAGNDVLNLTLPIVKEPVMPQRPVINIPRATRKEMAAFILEDLNVAEENMNYTSSSKETPHIDVVYGLKARLYMWIGDYENAKKYARMAIEKNTGHVMTQEECLSKNDGFNTPDPWMLATTTCPEDAPVITGIVNWTSWMSPEAQYGYSSAGATSIIDAAMYNRMSNTDFRKLMYKAPTGHVLESKVPYIDAKQGAVLPEYAAIKFRPNDGNTEDYLTGSVSSVPIMRIEEMYFIEAEAAERLTPGEGTALLADFMKKHRDAEYTFPADVEAIDEILFQKRVEFWGEGISFFDIKRANLSVTRAYEGSNVARDRTFNTDGRPAWMNTCIVITAKKENSAIEGWENPDPSDCYTAE